MASTYLSKTNVSQTLNSKFTISVWVKRAELSSSGMNAMCGSNSTGSHATQFFFDGPSLRFFDNYSSTDLVTNRKFRDTNAWYHVVAAIDTSQITAADRVKIYVNGTQETSFATSNYPTQNSGMILNINGYTFYVGTAETADGNKFGYFDGSMTHFHFSDGQAYAPTVFGETDSTSGIWKPKTAPSVTYGNNGFFLKFENSGNLDLDSSGNNLSFTTSGTLTQMVDTPSNNFNTLNSSLANSGVTSSNGNRSFNSGSAVNYGLMAPTFALNKGKWYFEYKIGHPCAAGFIADTYQIAERVRGNTAVGNTSEEYAWEGNGYIKTNGGQTAYGSSASANDIIGMYVDLDNNKLYIGINGTIQNSGTGFSITDPDSLTSGFYYIGGMSDQCGATANVTADINFGNGFFGTTAVSSAQADANGEGAFEYSPNDSGGSSFDSAAKNFYALNTKNIKEFG
jgi:hypothetical protein